MAIRSLARSSLESPVVKYNSLLAGNAAYDPSQLELIQSSTLSGTATAVTFANLGDYASLYKHLQLRIVVRNSGNTGTGGLLARFNGVDSASYNYHVVRGVGASPGQGGDLSQTFLVCGWVPHGNSNGGAFSYNIIDILDWSSNSKNKVSRSFTGNQGYDSRVGMISATWFNTAPITQIALLAEGGNSYATGSHFALYGIRSQ